MPKAKTKTAVMSVGGYDITVTYKRIKRLYLRVRGGAVSASVPFGTGDDEIRSFVLNNIGYINSHLASSDTSERHHAAGETVWIWGKEYPLRVLPGGRHSVRFDGRECVMTAPESSTSESREKALAEFYRRETAAALDKRMPALETAAGLYSSGRQIKNMRSRWGSCNVRTKHIVINLRLAMYPPQCLDQVIVHELIHTVIPGHGKDFYAYMDRLMPDWKKWRNELKRVRRI